MKRVFLSLVIALPAVVRAASPVGLLPEDKVPFTLEGNERNPFGKIGPKAATAVVENEESRIRAIVENLPVGGIIEGRTGRKVLLGSLVVEEGRVLPPVISRQTEKLQVLSVTPEKVEIAFLESDGTPGLRRIVVGLNIAPSVQFRVPKPAGKLNDSGGDGFDGVLKKDEVGTSR